MMLPGLMRFIRDHYGSLSVAAMIYAFELNCIGLLTQRWDHFQSFDIGYISNVLGDYLNLKRKVIADSKKLLTSKESDPVVSEKECYDFLIDFIKRNNQLPVAYDWNKAFEFMWNTGIVDESQEWMRDFRQKIENKMKSERLSEIIESGKLAFASKEITLESLRLRCRKEYLIYKLSPKP